MNHRPHDNSSYLALVALLFDTVLSVVQASMASVELIIYEHRVIIFGLECF